MPPRHSTEVVVRGAHEHNLKGVDLRFPRDALTTFTGVSGSGKSSLAYHTIYQEGQRRFLESLSSYARQFLGRMEKPKVEHVEGLSPTVSIDQKSVGHSPRSTVGTLTEVLDFLRLLYARLGTPACPECGARVEAWSPDQITAAISERFDGQKLHVLAPVVRERKGEYRQELQQWRARGFVRARIDGEVRRLDEEIELHRYKYHTIELVVDRLKVSADKSSRLAEAIEQALQLADGLLAVLSEDRAGEEQWELFSTQRACPEGHGVLPEIEPRLFSFNSPVGACSACDGLGQIWGFSEDLLVIDPTQSIRAGALACFTAEGKLVYSRLTLAHLEQVGAEFGFDLDTPWRKLTAKQRRILLRGSGAKKFAFRWRKQGANYAASGKDHKAFPGIIPHLERVYGAANARHLDRYRSAQACSDCGGARLNPIARAVEFDGRSLPQLLSEPIGAVRGALDALQLDGNRRIVGEPILVEIRTRLAFLDEVGLSYLTLDRRANSLSGGESQRIRLAAQVGSGLRGVLYVLDEPSIGLHVRDHDRLVATLKALRDRGNTVCVVEHDEMTMLESDFLVDVGPAAGEQGGEIVVAGTPREVQDHPGSLTGQFLRGEQAIEVPSQRRSADCGQIVVRGARHNNLQGIDVEIPLGRLVAVTGPSGSGKSSLINHILRKALRRTLHNALDVPGAHDRIDGVDRVDKIVDIDQAPIGRTPRSNPATYTDVWNQVRDLYASLPESKIREYKKGRFSFNVAGGRCETCQGAGVTTLEMQFLAPVEVECEDCGGRRFNAETLEIEFKGKNVADLLAMPVAEAHDFFSAIPKIERALRALRDVGLGYLRLGQPSTTLSGGEAQRVKLASELQRPATGQTLYLLDEPTTGLHFEDIRKLLTSIQQLVDAGNSVVVIEHNLDVIKCADWILDLGPEGGGGGGRLVAAGTPEQLVEHHGDTSTGAALATLLKRRKPPKARKTPRRAARKQAEAIEVRGASMHNLQKVDVDIPLGQFTVVSGPSGSGKSSLAFDTLFREGQRRFVESLSTYARRFLGRMDRAPVDRLDGIGPAIAIDQRSSHRSARSTVATATEIHDYLRLLYARIGRPHCPEHGHELVLHAPGSIARQAASEWGDQMGYVLAPFATDSENDDEERRRWLESLVVRWRESGFVRVLINGAEHRLDGEELPLPSDGSEVHLIVDRVAFKQRSRIVDSAAQAAEQAHGVVVLRTRDGEERRYTTDRSCPDCGFAVPTQPHPRYFSFNHHSGACAACGGLGEQIVCVPELLINRPHKPLFGGAINHKGRGFTFLNKRSGWHQKIARALAKRYGIDLSVPYEDLPDDHAALLLRGGVDDKFPITFQKNRSGSSQRFQVAAQWKGLLRIVEDWFHGAADEGGSEEKLERLHGVMRRAECRVCDGDRLQPAQRNILVGGKSLPAVSRWTVAETAAFFERVRLRKTEREVADQVLVEVRNRLGFLQSVGLEYLTLDRSAATLSGGEAQRIRLATQLGNRLVGVLYVLDEPTVGLHPRDTQRLLDTLTELRDLGNTVVAVEHDEQMIRAADFLVDVGPGSGQHGGRIMAADTPAAVAKGGVGLTADYLRGALSIAMPAQRRTPIGHLALRGACSHNLKAVDVDIPLGVMTAVTGVSGSGKSSLMLEELLPRLQDEAVSAVDVDEQPMALPAVTFVDQSPVGTTPSSNPATYIGVMTPIRELFAALPQSRVKGFKSGRFSFNVASGRCAACEGKGQIRVEMHFLADVWVTCEICNGRRYNQETLAVEYRGKTIADVLAMECGEALEFFGNHPRIARPLRALRDVGLGYLSLGQAANTLSGGEAQRIKLVARLAARSIPVPQIYLLDEPTTGLHVDDVRKLLEVLQKLVDSGDTVVVIEHHLDVIRSADHVIELGPEAGAGGGNVIATGTPEALAQAETPTAPYLAAALAEVGGAKSGPARRRRAAGASKDPSPTRAAKKGGARKSSSRTRGSSSAS